MREREGSAASARVWEGEVNIVQNLCLDRGGGRGEYKYTNNLHSLSPPPPLETSQDQKIDICVLLPSFTERQKSINIYISDLARPG